MDSPPPRSRSSHSATSWRTTVLGWFDPGEPQVHAGPFSRWPRSTDAALALLVFVGSLVSVTLSALPDGEDYTLDRISELEAPALALLAVSAGSLLLRRQQPLLVAAIVVVSAAAWAIAGYGDGNDLALIAALYAVGRYTTDPGHSVAALVATIGVSVLGTVIDPDQRIDVAPAVVLPVLAWYAGRRVRNRGDYVTLLRERSERLEADQQARARQAVAEERSRIARELHDVVAHEVSMMTVQAGAARTIARTDLDAAVGAMEDVERAGRRALGELRHLLGVLRAETTGTTDLGPQPGLADTPSLADHLSQSGAVVSLAVHPPDDLAASVDLSAYRIVQEAITNIIKHAGPHPTVEIAVESDANNLAIEITNTTASSTSPAPTSGFGIAGMKERANLLGGTLTIGPLPPNRFRVRADLPLEPEQP